MSKQDYELVASTIKQHAAMSNRVQLACVLAGRLRERDELFDPLRFVMASSSLSDRQAVRILTIHGVNYRPAITDQRSDA
jgi:hypothetical protein